MPFNSIQIFNIINLYNSIPISIQLIKHSIYYFLSKIVHPPFQSEQKLIIVNEPLLITIKVCKHHPDFFLCKSHLKINHSFSELIKLKLPVTTVIHNLELSSNIQNRTSSFLKPLFNFINNPLHIITTSLSLISYHGRCIWSILGCFGWHFIDLTNKLIVI